MPPRVYRPNLADVPRQLVPSSWHPGQLGPAADSLAPAALPKFWAACPNFRAAFRTLAACQGCSFSTSATRYGVAEHSRNLPAGHWQPFTPHDSMMPYTCSVLCGVSRRGRRPDSPWGRPMLLDATRLGSPGPTQ